MRRLGRTLRYRRWRNNQQMIDALRRHPPFFRAVIADTRFVASRQLRPLTDAPGPRVLLTALRFAWEHDSFGAQIAWRLRTRLLSFGVPVLPAILHRLCIVFAQMSLSPAVFARPGMAFAHGQATIGGFVEIGSAVTIAPFVSIGLAGGTYEGAKIGNRVQIGTGVRIIGDVTIGDGARIGANAVVLSDIPAGATAVGIPARVVRRPSED